MTPGRGAITNTPDEAVSRTRATQRSEELLRVRLTPKMGGGSAPAQRVPLSDNRNDYGAPPRQSP